MGNGTCHPATLESTNGMPAKVAPAVMTTRPKGSLPGVNVAPCCLMLVSACSGSPELLLLCLRMDMAKVKVTKVAAGGGAMVWASN